MGRINAELLIYPVCWSVVLVSAWAFWSWWRMTGNWFDPYTLFLLSAVLFSGGQAFLEVAGLNDSGILANRFSSHTALFALLAVTLGLSAMHLGVLLAVSWSTFGERKEPSVEDFDLEIESLRTAGWILLVVSAIPMVIIASDAVAVVWEGGYFALYQQDRGTGFHATPQILAQFFVPSTFLFLAANGGSKKYLMMSGAMMFFNSLIFLALGYRYYAIAPLLCYAWLWHRCRRPIPTMVIVSVGLVLVGIVFPTIKSIRNVALAERFSVDFIVNSFFGIDNPLIDAFAEMGGSLITVAYTMDLVPWVRPFDYGMQYLYSILTLVPNVFGPIHPSIAHGTPNAWLIQTVDPFTAMRGGGLGYSFVAEAFLGFGFWGVPVILFVIGFLYTRLIIWGTWSHSLGKIAVVAIFLCFFLFYPRSDSTTIIRPLVWYALLPYLLSRVLERFRRTR